MGLQADDHIRRVRRVLVSPYALPMCRASSGCGMRSTGPNVETHPFTVVFELTILQRNVWDECWTVDSWSTTRRKGEKAHDCLKNKRGWKSASRFQCQLSVFEACRPIIRPFPLNVYSVSGGRPMFWISLGTPCLCPGAPCSRFSGMCTSVGSERQRDKRIRICFLRANKPKSPSCIRP